MKKISFEDFTRNDIKTTNPNYEVMDDPLIKKLGYYKGGMGDWVWEIPSYISLDVLYKAYCIAFDSWSFNKEENETKEENKDKALSQDEVYDKVWRAFLTAELQDEQWKDENTARLIVANLFGEHYMGTYPDLNYVKDNKQ